MKLLFKWPFFCIGVFGTLIACVFMEIETEEFLTYGVVGAIIGGVIDLVFKMRRWFSGGISSATKQYSEYAKEKHTQREQADKEFAQKREEEYTIVGVDVVGGKLRCYNANGERVDGRTGSVGLYTSNVVSASMRGNRFAVRYRDGKEIVFDNKGHCISGSGY